MDSEYFSTLLTGVATTAVLSTFLPESFVWLIGMVAGIIALVLITTNKRKKGY